MVPFTHLPSFRLNTLPPPLHFVLVLGILGFATFTLGLFGILKPIAVIPLFAAAFIWLLHIYRFSPTKPKQSSNRLTCLLLTVFGASLGLNLLGVFVPETGFDALWYHLPIAQVYQSTGTIKLIPELIYSTMPRLGEMYFALAFFTGSPVLIKAVSYCFYLLYLFLAYRLSRRSLSQSASLLFAITLSSYIVVGWQASSAYVDLIQSAFELSALLAFFHSLSTKNPKYLLVAGIFSGFALSVKFQAFFGFFSLLILALSTPQTTLRQKLIHISLILLPALLVASPWYLDNYLSRGHFFYPVNHPALRQDVLAYVNEPSYQSWLQHQLLRLPLLIPTLSIFGRDLTSPILLILFPLLLLVFKKLWNTHRLLLIYTGAYLLIWWFFPPLEVRYALNPLVTLSLILFQSIYLLPPKLSSLKSSALIVIFLTVVLNLSLRLISSIKYFPLLTGHQSSPEYLQSKATDFNRSILEKYYSGYYQNYRYPLK